MMSKAPAKGCTVYWTQEQIIVTCRAWAARNGDVPPKSDEWHKSGPNRPTSATVLRRFGSWNTMIVAAGFVPRSRHKRIIWTVPACIAACRAWADKHGCPPKFEDWRAATPLTPASATVQKRCGSWNAMVRAAGYEPRPQAPPFRWTRESIAERMLDHLLTTGRWPTRPEWEKGGNHPAAMIVLARFGSWAAAKRYAGWDGSFRRARKLQTVAAPRLVEPAPLGSGADALSGASGAATQPDTSTRRAA